MQFGDIFVTAVWGFLFTLSIFKLFQCLKVVPQKTAMVVERLGRYHVTLNSGFHILIPWIDKVCAVLDLKEATIDVPPQECFTKDEVKVIVDGVIYISVVDPVKAAYGVTNYKWGAMQLAQTTTRSIIGKISLDKTFEEREYISAEVVHVLTQTQEEWGIIVHRYEVKNLQPPDSVRVAMERQVRAERDKKAIVAKALGEKQAMINKSEGLRIELINNSEGEKQKRINEAEGRAAEIKSVASATAESIAKLAKAIDSENGVEAVKLQLTEKYLSTYGKLADGQHDIVVPMDIADPSKLLKIADISKA